mgnify:FL=1
MKRWIRILAGGGVALVFVLAVATATRSLWLPERFAINVPVGSLVGLPP